MWAIATKLTACRRRASVWAIGLMLISAGVSGCGTVQIQAGERFNPALLEQSLRSGVSTQGDVKAALGEPYGQGRALMPFHETDRTVWTYFYERGSFDLSSSKVQDQRTYLFVFFAGNQLDGYMWFASDLH